MVPFWCCVVVLFTVVQSHRALFHYCVVELLTIIVALVCCRDRAIMYCNVAVPVRQSVEVLLCCCVAVLFCSCTTGLLR